VKTIDTLSPADKAQLREVFLLAAEQIHARQHFSETGEALERDIGSRFVCHAVDCICLEDLTRMNAKDLLFATYRPGARGVARERAIWDEHGGKYEERILGCLLLCEMLKPAKRRPKTVRKK
jgi:hypothetical protein